MEPCFVLDSFDMRPAVPSNLATELEAASGSGFVEHAEAVDDRHSMAGQLYDFVVEDDGDGVLLGGLEAGFARCL
jgi:hypothetical protein